MKKLVKRYKQIIYLLFLVAILLVMSSFEIKHSNNLNLQIFDVDIENSNNKNAYVEEDEVYLSLNILTEYIDKDIFYDKISGYIVITNNGNILKLKMGDNNASLNYKDISIEKGLVKKDNVIYVPVSSINKVYNITPVVNKDKRIYIVKNNTDEASIKNNNVNVYEKNNIKSDVVCKIKKNEKINIYYSLFNSDLVLVKNESGKVGYISKYNLTKDSINKFNIKQEELKVNENKIIETAIPGKINGIVYSDLENINNLTKQKEIDVVVIDMFEILKINGQVDVNKSNQKIIDLSKNIGYKVYGNIDNGYNSSNFDNTVIANIISNPELRDSLVINILKEVESYKLDGLVVDFESIKKSDEGIYIQFLKELSTAMNGISKKILIKNIVNSNNIDISKVLKYIDYYIIDGYNHRNIDSNISGTDSDINKITEDIDNVANINNGAYLPKVIAELPMYSILWEEKESKIVNSSIYSQTATEDYISKNKLTKKLDTRVNQNYVEIVKGITTYKMWVEDEYSIKEKIRTVKEKNLAGVIMYRVEDDNINFVNNIFK